MPAPILVTGAAGFIGHAVAHRLLARGERVIGVDIVNDYYDPALKEARLATFAGINSFAFERIDIADAAQMAALVRDNAIVRAVHLAAQAGVRYSIENPFAYERSNLAGHLSVMEACRHAEGFEHLVEGAESAGEEDHGRRAEDEVKLPQREVLELEAEVGGDEGIGLLLARELDVEPDRLAADVEGAAVGGFHDPRAASGDDHEITGVFALVVD